jgi:hypothetical protein
LDLLKINKHYLNKFASAYFAAHLTSGTAGLTRLVGVEGRQIGGRLLRQWSLAGKALLNLTRHWLVEVCQKWVTGSRDAERTVGHVIGRC